MYRIIIFLLSFVYIYATDVYNGVWVHALQRYNTIDIKHKKNYAAVQIVFDNCQFNSIEKENTFEHQDFDKNQNEHRRLPSVPFARINISTNNNQTQHKRKTIHNTHVTSTLQKKCETLSYTFNKNLYFSNGSKVSKTFDGRVIFWSFCIDKRLCKDILLKSQIFLRMSNDNIGTCFCNAQVLQSTKINFLPMVESLWISGRSLV